MRKVAFAASACVVLLTGCPRASSSGSGSGADSGSASDSGSDSGSGAGSDSGTASLPAAGYLADAGAATTPYVSKEGHFTVLPPAGVKPNETTAGVAWIVGSAALVVGYYDGRPHGVDRSRFYDLARDGVNGSEIEKEDDVKVGGFPTRMRRIRLVVVGKPVQFRRSAIVVAGNRTFEVSCTSSVRADLDALVTNAFFTSLHLEAVK